MEGHDVNNVKHGHVQTFQSMDLMLPGRAAVRIHQPHGVCVCLYLLSHHKPLTLQRTPPPSVGHPSADVIQQRLHPSGPSETPALIKLLCLHEEGSQDKGALMGKQQDTVCVL